MNSLFRIVMVVCVLSLSTACRKFIDIDPPVTDQVSQNVFSSNSTAAAAVTNLYVSMSNTGLTDGGTSISFLMGLYSDELRKYGNNAATTAFYSNSLTNAVNVSFFSELYQLIYKSNAIIAGLNASTSLTPVLKQQLLGEAKFMRAFYYFYAINLYGDLPLILTTDYNINNSSTRVTTSQIYDQIIADLKDAKNLLSSDFVNNSGTLSNERIRPNKGAASALLARVYLYTMKWSEAANEASAVISNNKLYELVSLDLAFKKNNREAIWQMQPVMPGYNTLIAHYFVFLSGYTPANPNNVIASVSSQLRAAFEENDKRTVAWIGKYSENGVDYYFPYKYQANPKLTANVAVTEYLSVLRLAEIYLIRAEARAQQNDVFGAQADLNAIRERAGLGKTGADNKDALLSAIAHERQVELFAEWGDRWFNLKRTGQATNAMKEVTPLKGGTWSEYKILLPIPKQILDQSPNLSQNQGY